MALTVEETGWLRRVRLRVRLARVPRGESQEQLGQRADVSRVTVGSIERGDHPAAVTTYARLARAVGLPLADVLDGAP
jgi:DNA-binding XRE family transcriptional regulator